MFRSRVEGVALKFVRGSIFLRIFWEKVCGLLWNFYEISTVGGLELSIQAINIVKFYLSDKKCLVNPQHFIKSFERFLFLRKHSRTQLNIINEFMELNAAWFWNFKHFKYFEHFEHLILQFLTKLRECDLLLNIWIKFSICKGGTFKILMNRIWEL